MTWHKYPDEKPNPGTTLLIYHKDDDVMMYSLAEIDDDGMWHMEIGYHDCAMLNQDFLQVSHWMEVEPPKETDNTKIRNDLWVIDITKDI